MDDLSEIVKAIIIFGVIGLVVLVFCLLNIGGKFISKTILSRIEKKIGYFYTELLPKFAIKGLYFGMMVGPLIMALKLVEELVVELVINKGAGIIDNYQIIYDLVATIYDKLGLNTILFCILLIIVSIILLLLSIFFIIVSIFFIGAILGAITGYVTNVLCGLIISLFVKIDTMTFSIYKFSFDLQTIVSTVIFGFVSGLIVSKWNLSFGIVGAFIALCYKYFDKLKNQVLFATTKKTINIILRHDKIIIICATAIILFWNSFISFPKFNTEIFLNKVFIDIPFVLFFLYYNKIKRNVFFHKMFVFSRDVILDYIGNEICPQIKKLPNNLLLHIFACTLTITVTYIFTLNTDVGGYVIYIVPVTILIIEKFKRVWLFMIFGVILDLAADIDIDSATFYLHLIIWATIGHIIIYLLKQGNHALTKRRIVQILKYLEEEKELYK